MQMKPFTELDWNGFAGSESFEDGTPPNIGECSWGRGDENGAVIIQDRTGLHAIFTRNDGHPEQWDLEGLTVVVQAMVVSNIPFKTSSKEDFLETLKVLGFKKL